MPIASIRLEGAKQLDKMLAELDRKVARKVLSASLRDGAKVISAQAKANAPVLSGLTRKQIKVRAAKKRRSETAAIKVTTGEGNFKGKTFYASFQEFGWVKAPTIRTSSGQFFSMSRASRRSTGDQGTKIPGKHFMENAFKSKASTAAKAATESMRKRIEQEAKKK